MMIFNKFEANKNLFKCLIKKCFISRNKNNKKETKNNEFEIGTII